MHFLGNSFFSGEHFILPASIEQKEFDKIQLNTGIYNQIFLGDSADLDVNDITSEWTENTIINADFNNGSADSSNTGFSVRTTDHVVIRRREVGTYEWTTIFVKEIHRATDFDINFIDTLAKSHTEYEYTIYSYANGVENNSFSTTVYSDFGGIYIVDKNDIYGTNYNPQLDAVSREPNASVINMLNNPMPTVASSSLSNYETGTASGMFIKIDEDTGELNRFSGKQMRSDVKDKLMSRKPYLLKTFDGEAWIVRTTGTVSESSDGHPDMKTISFTWTQIGKATSSEDLSLNGLTNIESRWW